MMHIEKRRHDRSPEPPRKRDYSPPPSSSHRDSHRGPVSRAGATSGAGSRRGHSPSYRESSGRLSPKRRRSADGTASVAAAASTTPVVEEDEETRAYRLKIEKQKAMRDKILRDKEMRRRRAAEQKEAGEAKDLKKGGNEESATVESREVAEPAPQLKQLKPIVVTEKKIISLRKGKALPPSGSEASGGGGEAKRVVVQRVAATVKPVVIKRSLENDSDDFDEDELLADSPPSSPTHQKKQSIQRSLTPPVLVTTTSKGSTRRIVVTNSEGRTGGIDGGGHGELTASKGVFDRLEKRVGITDGAKRKLKRIVIKHCE